MASSPPNNSTATPTPQQDRNVWASLPPLNTIKPEELIRYQIVDWDPNNVHHPRYLAGYILIESLFRRNHYYWIACSNPLPKKEGTKAPPPICISPPISYSTPTRPTAVARPLASSSHTHVHPVERDIGQHELASSPSTALTDSINLPTCSRPAAVTPGSNSNRSCSPLDSTRTNLFLASNSPPQVPGVHPLPSNSSSSASNPPSSPTATGLSASQHKRALKAVEQDGRNIRAEFGKATILKADEKPAGVGKAADGAFNLGPMAWHFRSLDKHDDVKSEEKNGR